MQGARLAEALETNKNIITLSILTFHHPDIERSVRRNKQDALTILAKLRENNYAVDELNSERNRKNRWFCFDKRRNR